MTSWPFVRNIGFTPPGFEVRPWRNEDVHGFGSTPGTKTVDRQFDRQRILQRVPFNHFISATWAE